MAHGVRLFAFCYKMHSFMYYCNNCELLYVQKQARRTAR